MSRMDFSDIEVGAKVRIIDHDYGNDGRDDATVTEVTEDGFTVTPKRPWSSQGRNFTTMRVDANGPHGWGVTRFGRDCLTLYRVDRYDRKLSVKSFIFDGKGA